MNVAPWFIEEMENPQEIWDVLKYIEQDVRGDVATFSDPTWRQYALDAIDEMRTYMFVFADGSVTKEEGWDEGCHRSVAHGATLSFTVCESEYLLGCFSVSVP